MTPPTPVQPLVTSTALFRLSDELIAALRQRVAGQYYSHPQVIDIIARAILHSRELYPNC